MMGRELILGTWLINKVPSQGYGLPTYRSKDVTFFHTAEPDLSQLLSAVAWRGTYRGW